MAIQGSRPPVPTLETISITRLSESNLRPSFVGQTLRLFTCNLPAQLVILPRPPPAEFVLRLGAIVILERARDLVPRLREGVEDAGVEVVPRGPSVDLWFSQPS